MQPASRRLVMGLTATAVVALIVAALVGGVVLGRPTVSASSPPMNLHLTSSNSPSAPGATISVTGTGTVEGTPDTLTLDIGITAGGSSAVGALDQANSEMRSLMGAFRVIPRSDLQTSGLSLNADYNKYGEITGYSSSEDLTVVIHQLSIAGRLIDAAAAAAGNFAQINGITFSISNTSSLIAQARAQAMQSAHTEAEQLAAGAGVKLGTLQSVTDQSQGPSPYRAAYLAGTFAAAASVPLDAGSQPVTFQVTVVYNVVQ
jgi:uncharacterized protein YggE